MQGNEKLVQVAVRIPESQRNKLKELCAREGMSINSILSEAITYNLEFPHHELPPDQDQFEELLSALSCFDLSFDEFLSYAKEQGVFEACAYRKRIVWQDDDTKEYSMQLLSIFNYCRSQRRLTFHELVEYAADSHKDWIPVLSGKYCPAILAYLVSCGHETNINEDFLNCLPNQE